MTKAKAESKDHKSQTHRHIFTTTTINSRLFLVAFECKTNFHSIALSHLPVPLSSCLPVWLSPCPAVSVCGCPGPMSKFPQRRCSANSFWATTTAAAEARQQQHEFYTCLASHPYLTHGIPPPNTVCQLTIPIGSCNKSTRLLSSVFDSEIPSLVPDIFPSITQLFML